MKKIIFLVCILIISILSVSADSQVYQTTKNQTVTDNSLVFKGYYKGAQNQQSNSIALHFYDAGGASINHDEQDTSGTVVHLNSNNGTVFTWAMTGTNQTTTTLKFTFTTFQAVLNGYYYRPTYSLQMTINPTKKNNSSGIELSDTFYSTANPKTKTLVQTNANASQNTEFTDSYSITYTGYTSSNNTWYRSGSCSINITSSQSTYPGEFSYICWVLAEYTAR